MSDPTFDEVLDFVRETYVHRELADVLEEKFRPKPVELHLSVDEVRTIRDILSYVNPSGVERGNHVLNLIEKLNANGFKYRQNFDIEGTISFKA